MSVSVLCLIIVFFFTSILYKIIGRNPFKFRTTKQKKFISWSWDESCFRKFISRVEIFEIDGTEMVIEYSGCGNTIRQKLLSASQRKTYYTPNSPEIISESRRRIIHFTFSQRVFYCYWVSKGDSFLRENTELEDNAGIK